MTKGDPLSIYEYGIWELNNMKCPFCGKEMEHGFLYANQGEGFPWYPDGEEPLRNIPDFRYKKKGAMYFGKSWKEIEPFEFDKMSFWLCKACMKGVADSLVEKKGIWS